MAKGLIGPHRQYGHVLENIRTSCLCRDSNRGPYIPQPSRYAASGAPSPAVNVNLKHFPKRSLYIQRFIPSVSQGEVYPSVERSAVQSVLKFVPGDISSPKQKHIQVTELEIQTFSE